jgi:hypothetical protein
VDEAERPQLYLGSGMARCFSVPKKGVDFFAMQSNALIICDAIDW